MTAKHINEELNSIAIIDNLIMELSYIRNGRKPIMKKLEMGISAIEHLISISDKSEPEGNEDKFGLSPLFDVQNRSSVDFDIGEYKDDLSNVKEIINESIQSTTPIDSEKIEMIQELLLKISLPIWKTQINSTNRNRFKLIEL